MNRACAHLWGAGAVVVFMSVPLGLSLGSNVPGVLFIATLAAVVALTLRLGQDRSPQGALQGFVALGSLAITMLMWFDTSPVSAYGFLYVWAALYAFYFFSVIGASLQVLLMAAFAGAELALHRPSDAAPAHWMLIVSTVVVAGMWIRHLVGQVRRRADFDGLTGVANRLQLDEMLPRILDRAGRSGEPLTLAMLDLDNFKAFNDECGHLAGDEQLRRTASAWLTQLRATDLLVRYGGEEFVVVLPNCGLETGLEVVERTRVATPNSQTCSAGIAVWDRQESASALVGRADDALYDAKKGGRDRIVVASAAHRARAAGSTSDWAAVLPGLLGDGRVRSVFQPIVWLESGQRHAVEALARLGDLPPDASVEEAFSAAQRVGLARDLDWASRRAALEGAELFAEAEVIFVNTSLGALLSPLQTVDQTLLILESAGRSARTIVLEITERDVVRDRVLLTEVLTSYRAEGFRFALDDVGEGLSSLLLMSVTCPEYIKVARSTTATLGSLGSRAAVRAIVAFAAETGARVIAEGIETTEQAEQLMELGVQLGQGYLLGRPAWPEDLLLRPAVARPDSRVSGRGGSVAATGKLSVH